MNFTWLFQTVTVVTKTTDQVTIRNKIRKEIKIFEELTICGTGTPSEYMMLGNDAIDVFNAWTINLQFVTKHSICGA